MALRYFGSKSWLKEKLADLVPKDTKILVSPFLGSGKAELHLAKTRPGVVVMGSDLFEPLVTCHQKLQDGSLFEPLQAWVDASLSKEEHTKLLASILPALRSQGRCLFHDHAKQLPRQVRELLRGGQANETHDQNDFRHASAKLPRRPKRRVRNDSRCP